MVATLVHRGPDQQGIFTSNLFSLGAARLKIIDLECGNQPILEKDGKSGIVFNGEIYNHLQVRAELEKLGHTFTSHSDTETVLKAFLQWDTQCFARLRGMFAFAVWNVPQKRIVLARDRMGIKPLYFARTGDDLYFGSELKAILSQSEIERRLSREALDCYLSLNYIPSPFTLIDGIRKVPPGSWMEWKDGEITTNRYWQLPYGEIREISLEDAKEQLDTLLTESIREHLLSDVPLGVWLSGGIDSTSILHYAAAASSSRLKSFSISFRARSFDESSYIRMGVQEYGTDHDEMDLNPGVDLASAIEEFAYYSDEPSADAGALPVWFLSKLCKRKTTVALSGEGADELFGGYPSFRATPYLAKLLAVARLLPERAGEAISQALLEIQRYARGPNRADKLRKIAAVFSHPEALPHAYFFARMLFTPRQTERLLSHSMIAMHRENGLGDAVSWRHSLEQLVRCAKIFRGQSVISYLEMRAYMLNTLLRDTDSMSMHHSLEIRVPLLDRALVEFVQALPDKAKARARTPKALLAEAVKDLLPAEILRQPKRAFTLPWEHWLRGKLGTDVACGLETLTPSLALILDSEAVQSVWRRFLGRQTGWARPWSLFVLNEWVRRHIDEAESCAELSKDSAAEAAAS